MLPGRSFRVIFSFLRDSRDEIEEATLLLVSPWKTLDELASSAPPKVCFADGGPRFRDRNSWEHGNFPDVIGFLRSTAKRSVRGRFKRETCSSGERRKEGRKEGRKERKLRANKSFPSAGNFPSDFRNDLGTLILANLVPDLILSFSRSIQEFFLCNFHSNELFQIRENRNCIKKNLLRICLFPNPN